MRLLPFSLPPTGPGAAVVLLGFLLALGLQGCSLSLEDPEVEARKKLAKLVTPSWDILEGRWVGDSTYTIFDTRASDLDGWIMDVFPDSTVWARDNSLQVFPQFLSARAALAGDTLILTPAPGKGLPDTFQVKIRFLGNWLDLVRARDQRFIHLHKLKPFDTAIQAALLDSGIWIRRIQRIAYDTSRIEALRRDFDYLRFSGDTLYQETRRNGIGRVAAGPLRPDGKRWIWSAGGGDRTVHFDLYHSDSLRYWPYNGTRPDSGYSLYTRNSGLHGFDLDMTPYAGHLRTDTVMTAPATAAESHFGRFYDLVLGKDHTVNTLTNMPGMPRFKSWVMDTGFLFLEGDSAVRRTRFDVQKISPQSLRLISDSVVGHFARTTTLVQTLVDGAAIAADPLARFDQASYLHVFAGTDTLAYYFFSASLRGPPEEHEIARMDSADTSWAAWRVNPSLETYGSSQPGFLFIFSGRTQALGRFTCRSSPTRDLAIRSIASPDPNMARGQVQGSCRLTAAENMPADSALSFKGEFRSKRRNAALISPFWKLP